MRRASPPDRYDLNGFATKHPGGEFWLGQTIGMDITELYVTHHLGRGQAKADA